MIIFEHLDVHIFIFSFHWKDSKPIIQQFCSIVLFIYLDFGSDVVPLRDPREGEAVKQMRRRWDVPGINVGLLVR